MRPAAKEITLAALRDGLPRCLSEIREATHLENIKGRVRELRMDGWPILSEGLCRCHGVGVYRLSGPQQAGAINQSPLRLTISRREEGAELRVASSGSELDHLSDDARDRIREAIESILAEERRAKTIAAPPMTIFEFLDSF